ncbi:13955_t:CDS:2 [Dentiscutata erythropus]|uniref:13955_t:CDS:1 n=1 Tax=Dentiscutata erythropus TaxID=1348616 RepID=A0A9N8VSP8_9GLOM|nr:13955_t:CDS:2 [Dentiscutata erythropus]
MHSKNATSGNEASKAEQKYAFLWKHFTEKMSQLSMNYLGLHFCQLGGWDYVNFESKC